MTNLSHGIINNPVNIYDIFLMEMKENISIVFCILQYDNTQSILNEKNIYFYC